MSLLTSTSPISTWRCMSCKFAVSSLTRTNIPQKRHISIQQLDEEQHGRERIVVLGSGWAGYGLGRQLNHMKYQVVTVSPRSYFVFTPLLASTSTGTLEFRTAIEPVRSRRSRGEYFEGWADAVDFDKKTLTIEDAVEKPTQRPLPVSSQEAKKTEVERATNISLEAKKGHLFDMKWDKLVIAVGCYNQTFDTKGVREHAYFLKDVGDARRIRKRLLACFETASLPTTSEETRRQLLNFAVVGGGPTGIEWSAELHDLLHEDLHKIYPGLAKYTKITVYDVAPKVLSMFDEQLGQYAMDHFRREGISIKTNHHVEELRRGWPGEQAPTSSGSDNDSDTATGYTLRLKEQGEVGIGMCVWSTGLMMNPFVQNALAGKVKKHEKSGGVLTNERLQAKGEDDQVLEDVFALGDCAVLEGTSYPATAQVANQKASWLAKRLNRGDLEQKAFTYRDLGVMAYIGNWKAILQSSGGEVSGRAAWIIWRGAYLAKSVSWRNRILIPVYWFVNWAFGRDVSRF